MTRGLRLVGMLLVAAGAAGCGSEEEGPERFNVSGTVKYNGQPLAEGSIMFTPAPGNPGPQGYATITEGEFDTSADGGAGVVGGKHTITIKSKDFEYKKPDPVDLPKESSTQTFDIKESEVTKITAGPEV